MRQPITSHSESDPPAYRLEVRRDGASLGSAPARNRTWTTGSGDLCDILFTTGAFPPMEQTRRVPYGAGQRQRVDYTYTEDECSSRNPHAVPVR